jgi:hypothetical protein
MGTSKLNLNRTTKSDMNRSKRERAEWLRFTILVISFVALTILTQHLENKTQTLKQSATTIVSLKK